MNFLKSVFGVGKPSEQQQLSDEYAEFLTFQLSCRYFDYNLLSGSKICQCIDGTAGFDVKIQQSSGEKELSILIKNNLHDDEQDNANLMLFPLNASVSIKRQVCLTINFNRYKYDQNDDDGIQQGFALQYASREGIKFLIEFQSGISQQLIDEFHDKTCCLLFEQLQGIKPTESDKMSYQQLILQEFRRYLEWLRFSDYYKDIIAPAPSPSFAGNQYQEGQQEQEEKFTKSHAPKFNKPSGISLSIEENQPKFPSFPTLFSGAGSLYLFDRSNNSNTLAQNSVVFTVLQRTDFSDKKNPKYCYGIGVFDGDESITIADFNQDTHLSLSPYQNSIFWVSYDLVADVINSWVFRFQNEGVIFKLKSIFARCNLQLQRQQDYDKAVKEEDREWIENSYCNMRDVDSLEPDEQMDIEDMQFQDPEQQQQEEEDDDEKNVPGGLKFIKPYENQDPNKHRETIQAGSYNRTFTVRGKDVSVYRQGGSKGAVQGDDEGLQHVNTFNQIMKKQSDNSIIPRQMMFHGNEKRMIFLDQNEKNKMFCMDLQTAKVIDEWKTNKDQNDIVQISNAFKNAQLQNVDQFVGVGNNVVQMYDPRLNTQLKACNERAYKTNPKFSCVVTTKTGELATGSQTGEIKLYSKVGQIAKTALPGLGDPIRHIDSTQDGLWVLATCDKYLLVIPTYMHNTSKKNYGDSNGFKIRMGKDKPSPLKLTIKPRDIAYYGIKTVKFSGAKFNTSKESGQETSISTSTGEFLITWSFSKVQKGILQDYKIKPMRDSVCENQFKFGTDQSIVVTFPEKLQMQKRRKI